MNKIQLVFWMLVTFSSTVAGQKKLDDNFMNFKGTIVVFDQQSNKYIIHNDERAAIRYSPFSTYKIPNSIVALETQIVSDTKQIIKWDEKKYPIENWWPMTWFGEHNLKSAIKFSVVPAYRHIASLIGIKIMQSFVDSFNYGNTIRTDCCCGEPV